MIGSANGDYGITKWPSTAASVRRFGPCISPRHAASVIINVTTPSDLNKRLTYSPHTTVTLLLLNDLYLPQGSRIFFNASFSCTLLTSSPSSPPYGYALFYTSHDAAALSLVGLSNFVSLRVSFGSTVFASSPNCRFATEGSGTGIVCPAILVYKSYGVQIGQGRLYGRVDIVKSMNVRVDSLIATSPVRSFARSAGVMRVARSGLSTSQTKANIMITNNEIYGVDQPVVMHGGAIGVAVYNNYIHDFGFAGIRCGDRISEVFGCAMTDVSQNLVVAKRFNVTGDADAAGLYWNTHWYAPGNTAQCNYVINGDHCLYFDNWSSDIRVTGGACINTRDGVKVNNGRRNVVKNLILSSQQGMHGWASCLFWNDTNCLRRNGRYYEAMRKKHYYTPNINKMYPWWSSTCSATTANGGYPCNPPSSLPPSMTANCSGMPVDNLLDIIVLNATHGARMGYKYCDKLTGVPKLNRMSAISFSAPGAARLNNYHSGDFGLMPESQIFSLRPGFQSCPRRYVGPQKFSQESFAWNFNIPRPAGFDALVVWDGVAVFDMDLATASSVK